ncbi:hypothetical protein [Terasakiella pusilla]|jgi:hypothetical protein|uniref:hypothetical protein n=1 Tax=Terasakiella pusilla TaxID=64973 RepID=UPI0012EC81FA|nr:hypothetical protein [Terasakiella pusilla]
MLDEKYVQADLRQNPGVIIGREEMVKFLEFVKTIPQHFLLIPKEENLHQR